MQRLGLPCQNSTSTGTTKKPPNALVLELQHCHNLLLTFLNFLPDMHEKEQPHFD
jgi:hypothetical protein